MTYNQINLLTGTNGSICENLAFTNSIQQPIWFIETMMPNEYGMAALEEDGYGTVAVQGAGEHGQRTFYMSYALGQLVDNDQGTREELLSRIVDWLLIGVNVDEHVSIDQELCMDIYPNPAEGEVAISVSGLRSAACPEGEARRIGGQQSAVSSQILLQIFDLYGREVRTLEDDMKFPGEYSVRIDISDLPAGVYLVRVQAGNKMAVVKLCKL